MVNPDGTTDAGLDTLKARQRGQKAARKQKPTAATDPIVVTSEELARPITQGAGLPATLAAATITPPIVSGPFAADDLSGYVIADRDAVEVVIPHGTTIETTRVLWNRGDRVRRDVHDSYWNGVEKVQTAAESA